MAFYERDVRRIDGILIDCITCLYCNNCSLDEQKEHFYGDGCLGYISKSKYDLLREGWILD